MISLKRTRSAIDDYLNQTVKEYLMNMIGMGAESGPRKLYDQGGEYIVTEMIKKASESNHGYATVDIPFSRIFSYLPSWLGGSQIRQIAVVVDPKLAREIGNYGTGQSYDPEARLPFRIIDLIMKSIVSRNDPQVKDDRKIMKQMMHNFDWNLLITKTEFEKWLKVGARKPVAINLENSIKITMIKILGQSLLGFHVFPPDQEGEEDDLSLSGLARILDRMDEAIILFDTVAISRYETQLWEYSRWFYQHNRQTIEDKSNQHNIFPFLVKNKDNLEKVNLAAAFLVTPNITKLIYLTIIFFATHPNWQTYLRQILNGNGEEDQVLKRLYMEFCRLFIPTAIPRYTSREVVFSGVKFKANTMFYISGRAIRMNPEIFPEPEKFWPDRFRENEIRMNSYLLSPFGIGVRQCPAASQFTEKVWRKVVETVFRDHRIEMVNQIKMEEFPIDVQIIKLYNQYFALIIELEEDF